MLSQTAEYALRAVLYVAEHGTGRPVRGAEMADALRIPRNYLSKILHQLARHGVLVSLRGKAGGFQLCVQPDRLALGVVVAVFDGIGTERRCLLGRSKCTDGTASAAYFFRDTTVADLLGSGAIARN